MNKEILDNIEIINEILMSTTLLSNNSCLKWKQDSYKLIEFICEAYDVNHLKDEFCRVITQEVNNLSLINEYSGLRREHEFSDEYSELELIYNLKGKTLVKIANIDKKLESFNSSSTKEFTYDDSTSYFPTERFDIILKASSYGDPQLTCQVGLMYALGIGTDVDYDFAIIRLKQAAYWGYIPAIKYLANIYGRLNDVLNYDKYSQLYEVCYMYFYDGIPAIPEKVKHKYTKEVDEEFSVITSIYQDIVIPRSKRIDYSFLELIFNDKINFNKKMEMINTYDSMKWKQLTGSMNQNQKLFNI